MLGRSPVIVIVAAALLANLPACTDEPNDDSPEGALVLFLEAMERSRHDGAALRQAYDLLDEAAQVQLQERAENAGSPGHTIEPWEMIVRGRFRVRLDWRRAGALTTRANGDEAVVVVGGPEGAQAEVPMVREHGHWRVALVLAPEAPDPEETDSDAGADGGPDADGGG